MAKTKKIKEMECTTLLMEVGYDYSRTMNKIIFGKYLEENILEEAELELTMPKKKFIKEVR